MRFIKLLLPFNRLTRLLTSFSVRTRIIVLALVPVVGFLANGLTYVSGAGDVATAFATVNRSGALADASRDFKIAIAAERIVVKDFGLTPSNSQLASFDVAHALALKSLNTIAASVDHRYAENIVGLRDDVMEMRKNFNEMVREQETLGFDEASGLRGHLRNAGNAVERIINENTTWLAEAETLAS